jgi:hypothetical protein
MRRASATTRVSWGKPTAIPRESLTSKRSPVRRELGDDASIDELIKRFYVATAPHERRMYLSALGNTDSEKALPVFTEVLNRAGARELDIARKSATWFSHSRRRATGQRRLGEIGTARSAAPKFLTSGVNFRPLAPQGQRMRLQERSFANLSVTIAAKSRHARP